MKVKLKGRKKVQIWGIKILGVIIVIISSFILSFKLLFDKIDLKMNNTTYLNYLVNTSFGYYNMADITNLSSTEFLLKYSLYLISAIFNCSSNSAVFIKTPFSISINKP